MGYTVVLQRESDGGYVASVPVLPGCVSQGRTLDDVHANIQEAMIAYIETLSEIVGAEHGRVRPARPGRSVRVTHFTLEPASA